MQDKELYQQILGLKSPWSGDRVQLSVEEEPWRAPIASLNYLLSSHVWRQDHNGFSHQDPGFLDHVANKKAEIVRN